MSTKEAITVVRVIIKENGADELEMNLRIFIGSKSCLTIVQNTNDKENIVETHISGIVSHYTANKSKCRSDNSYDWIFTIFMKGVEESIVISKDSVTTSKVALEWI